MPCAVSSGVSPTRPRPGPVSVLRCCGRTTGTPSRCRCSELSVPTGLPGPRSRCARVWSGRGAAGHRPRSRNGCSGCGSDCALLAPRNPVTVKRIDLSSFHSQLRHIKIYSDGLKFIEIFLTYCNDCPFFFNSRPPSIFLTVTGKIPNRIF